MLSCISFAQKEWGHTRCGLICTREEHGVVRGVHGPLDVSEGGHVGGDLRAVGAVCGVVLVQLLCGVAVREAADVQ